jgi:HSP20 family molecular chaperone IbpA
MAAIDPRTLMWTRACELIDRAERLHRQFFQLTVAPVRELSWEPPVDVIETGSEILIIVALPGVEPETVKLTVDANMLTVAGFRCPRAMARGTLVHRLELPYGKFERQLALPTSHFQLSQPEFSNGCLVLALSKRRLMEERTDV